MTVKELVKQLRKICKVHPEAKEARVEAVSDAHDVTFALNYVNLRKHYGKVWIDLEE